ncbi:ferredoxin [Streptomyces mirabilis]|uniref:ferredoxin n=1 Tax=Streptomyces mirabilis TaxID=68239 RepID=UPI003664A4D4
MKVAVDRERCEGHGSCQETAPQVFEVAEDGTVRMLMPSVPENLEAGVRTATPVCPVAAPILPDDPGRQPQHSRTPLTARRAHAATRQWPAAPMHR